MNPFRLLYLLDSPPLHKVIQQVRFTALSLLPLPPSSPPFLFVRAPLIGWCLSTLAADILCLVDCVTALVSFCLVVGLLCLIWSLERCELLCFRKQIAVIYGCCHSRAHTHTRTQQQQRKTQHNTATSATLAPNSTYALHLWDVYKWLDDLYQAEVAASAARRAKLQSGMRRAAAMALLGGGLASMAKAAAAAEAKVGANDDEVVLPSLPLSRPSTVIAEDDSDEMDTPRMLHQFTTALRPVVLVGHSCVCFTSRVHAFH